MNQLENSIAAAPRPPVILLGASNLTRDFPLILRLLQTSNETPADIYAAMGHGRSYGNWSKLLNRALPGITRCELWDALPTRKHDSLSPRALLTDIGNDLIYGQSPETILGWVKQATQRLQQLDAKIVLTLLPETSLARLSNLRFELTRRLFFPKNPASLADLIQKVKFLNQQLKEYAQSAELKIVEADPQWYGFDPIHYRYSQRALLWKTILSHWELTHLESSPARQRWFDAFYAAQHLQPATRKKWGQIHRCPQPVKNLTDGTRIFVY